MFVSKFQVLENYILKTHSPEPASAERMLACFAYNWQATFGGQRGELVAGFEFGMSLRIWWSDGREDLYLNGMRARRSGPAGWALCARGVQLEGREAQRRPNRPIGAPISLSAWSKVERVWEEAVRVQCQREARRGEPSIVTLGECLRP